MSDVASQTFLTAYDSQSQIRNDISDVAINWFVNRTPLVTRLARRPVGSVQYTIVTRKYRPRAYFLHTTISSSGTTSVVLNDASPLMNGDILSFTAGGVTEYMEITADPVVSTNTITVRRGIAATTAGSSYTGASDNSGQAVLLVGNSRTGSEVNQSAENYLPVPFTQYNQTWQHPVQVGGSLQSSSSFVPAPDAITPMDQAKMSALQNLMDDMEVSSYIGYPEAPTSGLGTVSRPKQAGLIKQIVTNLVTSPSNAGAYTPQDLIRDTIQPCRANGGNPDVLLVSPEWETGFAIWQTPIYRIMAGNNVFGTPVDAFQAPFAGGLTIIYAPLLPAYTAVCFNSAEVFMKMKRNEFWQPRGVRGDAMEGDFIAEGSIEVDNEYHHAYLTGVTAFSAT